MVIETGTSYINRTWKYLLPCLKYYGPIFKKKYSTLFTLAVGVGDTYMKKYEGEKCLYLLVNTAHQPKYFKDFSEWIMTQEYHLANYTYDSLVGGHRHMYLLKIPQEYHKAYDMFLEGRYSEMYTLEEIQKLYPTEEEEKTFSVSHQKWLEAKKILIKHPKEVPNFIERLKKEFGNNLDLKTKDFLGKELDFPLSYKTETEIFNYNE